MHAGTRWRPGGRLGPLFVAVVGIAAASMAMPTFAWAAYRTSGAETNTFATHVLVTMGQPSCAPLNLLTVTLSWSPPSDSAYVTSYEIGSSSSSTGSFPTYATGITGTSATVAVPTLTTRYFVVRSANHAWRGPDSPSKAVFGAAVVATC